MNQNKPTALLPTIDGLTQAETGILAQREEIPPESLGAYVAVQIPVFPGPTPMRVAVDPTNGVWVIQTAAVAPGETFQRPSRLVTSNQPPLRIQCAVMRVVVHQDDLGALDMQREPPKILAPVSSRQDPAYPPASAGGEAPLEQG